MSIPEANTLVQNATYHAFGNYTGLLTTTINSNLWPDYTKDYTSHGSLVDFASVFGVLFSGVTGIMAGANMSGKFDVQISHQYLVSYGYYLGELKNPSKNIPNGTLSAMLFTFVVYIAIAILTAATSSRFLLHNNYLFMIAVNFWPVAVAIGIVTATFSASLSNLIGSSRVLEALAKDQVFGLYQKQFFFSVWYIKILKFRFIPGFCDKGYMARKSLSCCIHQLVPSSNNFIDWIS